MQQYLMTDEFSGSPLQYRRYNVYVRDNRTGMTEHVAQVMALHNLHAYYVVRRVFPDAIVGGIWEAASILRDGVHYPA